MKLLAVCMLALCVCNAGTPAASNDVESLVDGFLVGFFKDENMKQAAECFDQSAVAKDIAAAYADLKALNFSAAVADLKKAFGEVGPAIDKCVAEESKAAAMKKLVDTLALIKDPDTLVKTISKNLVGHMTEVFTLFKDIETSIKAEKFYDAGHDIGSLINILLFGEAVETFPIDEVTQGLLGFMVGFYRQDYIKDGINCVVNHSAIVWQDILTTWQYLQQHEWMKAVTAMEDAFSQLNDAVKVCYNDEQVNQLVATTEKVIAEFKDISNLPSILLKNALANAGKIFGDVTGAVTHFKAQDWYQFAFDIGDVLHLLLLGDTTDVHVIMH